MIVLALAGISARSCGSSDSALSQDQAIAAARKALVFKDERVLTRYLNQGIPPRGTWIVSFYTGPPEKPVLAQTILVDAETGSIIDDGR